jgi:ligand-binding sensor domain-containing protein
VRGGGEMDWRKVTLWVLGGMILGFTIYSIILEYQYQQEIIHIETIQNEFKKYEVISFGPISDIAIDKNNRVWVGTWHEGLFIVDGEEITNYNANNSIMEFDYIESISIDQEGQAWVIQRDYPGYAFALHTYDGEEWGDKDISDGQTQGEMVYFLEFDRTGRVWVSHYSPQCNGLSVLENGQWINFNQRNSNIAGTCVNVLSEDTKGKVWVGFSGDPGGISVLNGDKWRTINNEERDLSEYQILSITFDSLGNGWIGTSGGGLRKFDGEEWTLLSSENSGLASDMIFSLISDSQNRIWIGTDKGLSIFDGEIWKTYLEENSILNSNFITSMAIDNLNHIWIGTMKGLIYIESSISEISIPQNKLNVYSENALAWHNFHKLLIPLVAIWVTILTKKFYGILTATIIYGILMIFGTENSFFDLFIWPIIIAGFIGGVSGDIIFLENKKEKGFAVVTAILGAIVGMGLTLVFFLIFPIG